MQKKLKATRFSARSYEFMFQHLRLPCKEHFTLSGATREYEPRDIISKYRAKIALVVMPFCIGSTHLVYFAKVQHP